PDAAPRAPARAAARRRARPVAKDRHSCRTPEARGGLLVDYQALGILVRIPDDHHAIVAGRPGHGHVSVAHVDQYPLGLTGERIAPPPAAAVDVAQHGVGV